jgi:hypothetical protein
LEKLKLIIGQSNYRIFFGNVNPVDENFIFAAIYG